jgi:S-adenosylmethionine decarboxylase
LAGIEWLLEIYGCPEKDLRSQETLTNLFRALVSELKLNPLGDIVWHRFPDTGGMTGFWLSRSPSDNLLI